MKKLATGLAVIAMAFLGFTAVGAEGQKMEPLNLTSVCSNNPAETRKWRVQNTNDYEVDFTYTVVGTDQTDTLTAPAAGEGVVKFPSATDGANYMFFETDTVEGPNTTKITFDGGERVKASSGAACDSFVQFEKTWMHTASDDINFDDVTVTVGGRINGDNPFSWTIGVDEPLQVTPGETELTNIEESVAGLPDNCSYESDLASSIVAPSSDSAYDDQTNVATVTITNTVECDTDDSGEVLGDSDQQVEVTPTSGVNAGGATIAVAGATISVALAGAGLAIKKHLA